MCYVDLAVLTGSELSGFVAWVGGWECEGCEGGEDEEDGEKEGGSEVRWEHGG